MFTFMFRICMYVLILPNKYQSINQKKGTSTDTQIPAQFKKILT